MEKKMKKISLLTIWITLFILPGMTLASTSEKRIALVIGNSDYMSSPLLNPMNDAISMEAALNDCNFNVTRRLNLNRKSMFEVIREFGNRLKRADVGLFYFAGHALQVKGENYLIPIGANVKNEDEVRFECLEASMVTSKMETAANKLNIIILDACRDNPFRSFRSSSSGLAEMKAPVGTVIQYATAPGSRAIDFDESSEKNGLYTSKLLKYIQTPGLEINMMFRKVRQEVHQASQKQQTPWESNSLMGGAFYFKPLLASGSHTIVKPQPSMKTGAVHIETTPSQADIYINNQYRGQSALDLQGIKPGKIRIQVKKSGYLSSQKTETITSGEIKYITFYLEKEVTTGTLNVKPENATIRILNIREKFYQGMTLSPGQYHLEISKSGYETYKKWITIKAGDKLDLNIDLKPLSRAKQSFTNKWGMTFVRIPSGSFMMGSPKNEPGRFDWEEQHKVTLTQDYFMQTTEVTQGQWKAIMGSNPSGFKECGDNCPVVFVSWNDVQTFLKKLNRMDSGQTYRLPTEAEWEYAARAGTTTPFAFGNCLSTNDANYDGNYPLTGCSKGQFRKKTIAVGSLRKNAWDLYDMHGNVYEWCQDWFATYPTVSVTNPTGPATGLDRVIRGGSWGDNARYCRSALRGRLDPGDADGVLGFRLCAPGR
jgi:formylglycine-generating enzyme required for sulfatase activity